MTSDSSCADFLPKLPDPAELTKAWTTISANFIDAATAQMRRDHATAPLPFDPAAPAWAMVDLGVALWSDPLRVLPTKETIEQWSKLWWGTAAKALGAAHDPVATPERGDRRFNHKDWSELPAFDYLKQAYLLATRRTLELVASMDLDPQARTRVDFYMRQFLNAVAPSNFALSNPEALRTALQSGGVSLLSGFANMIADSASPAGLVQRRSDEDFELGVNIAATPGSVIYQNELIQLIQYAPATAEVYKRPLLYIAPLVNKYYLLDLQAKSSMIRWLVEQGHTVFAISWVNPGAELRDKGMEDYILSGPVEALRVIERATGERAVDTFGFCMGGTMLAIAAAYLAGIGEGDRIASISVFGTLLDFSDMGEWETFYDPSNMNAVRRHVEAEGFIGAEKLQALFSAVRANDLIWSSVVNHYLMDRTAPPSDLLFWFVDGARIPAAFLTDYGRLLLRENALREPGGIVIGGVPIDLGEVTAPATLVSLKDDHVSGWEETYDGARLLGGPTRFILGGSGHNAGLVNPPSANKHGYWLNDARPDSAAEWFEAAQKREGSWWPEWQAWLADNQNGERTPARIAGTADLPVLEPAPGSYVRVKG